MELHSHKVDLHTHWDEPLEGRSLLWSRVRVIALATGVLLLLIALIAHFLGLG